MIICDIDFYPLVQPFLIQDKDFLAIGDNVVVKTQYGNRIGKVIKKYETTDNQIRESILSGTILSVASADELKKLAQNAILEKKKFCDVKKLISNANLMMNLLAIRYDLDQSSCIVFFTSDKMIDFRELLKLVNHELGVKVRLENIGDARTYAKLQGGCGVCGLELCCKHDYNNPDKVGKKSMKVQNIAYNPMNNYGNCNRLKCCLSYEEEMYEYLNKTVPKKGDTIIYQHRKYTVSARNLIKEEVEVIDTYNQNNDTLKLNCKDVIRANDK